MAHTREGLSTCLFVASSLPIVTDWKTERERQRNHSPYLFIHSCLKFCMSCVGISTGIMGWVGVVRCVSTRDSGVSEGVGTVLDPDKA